MSGQARRHACEDCVVTLRVAPSIGKLMNVYRGRLPLKVPKR